jgi:hypothetical protein
MTLYSPVYVRRAGGWYAVSFLVVGIFVEKLLWGFSWTEQSLLHQVSVCVLLPYVAYRLGSIAELRVVTEGENALLQGIACLLICAFFGALALGIASVLQAFVNGTNPLLYTTSSREIATLLAKVFIPIAPLGVLLGASLGLLRNES